MQWHHVYCAVSMQGGLIHERNVRPSNVSIVPTFLYHTKDHSPSFLARRTVGVERPLLPEILAQTDPVGVKMSIFNRYSLIPTRP